MGIPTVLVSGALGSGKTTLLKAIVAANPQRRFGIVVNEFGEMGVDGDLLRPLVPEIVEIRNGCICCATQDQLAPAINELLRTYHVDMLLLEMSGVAEPLPVLQELRILTPLIEICSHAVLVDAMANLDITTRDRSFRNAVANADIMILTKVDIAEQQAIADWTSFVGTINGSALLLQAKNGDVPLSELIVPSRRSAEESEVRRAMAHDSKLHRFTSFCLFVDSLSADKVRSLVLRCGEKVARIKGIVLIDDVWSEVQVVRGDLRIQPFDGPGPDRGRLVFISSAVYQQELRTLVSESFQEVVYSAASQPVNA